MISKLITIQLIGWVVAFLANRFGFIVFESLQAQTVIFVCACLLAFNSGLLLYPRKSVSADISARLKNQNVVPSFLIKLIFVFSIVGLAIQFSAILAEFARYGISAGLKGATVLRTMTGVERGPTVLNALGLALGGFPVVAGFCLFRFWRVLTNRMKVVFLLLFGFSMLLVILNGGRTGLFFGLSMCVFGWFFANRFRLNFTFRQFVICAIGTALLSLFVGLVFVWRIEATGGDSLEVSSYFADKPRVESVELIQRFERGMSEEVLQAVAFFEYYIGHPVSQLDTLMLELNGRGFVGLGRYNFLVLTHLLNSVGLSGVGLDYIFESIPNPGIYPSLLGALYIDFRFAGSVLVLFIFGLLLRRLFEYIKVRESLSCELIVCLGLLIVINSPIVSVIPMSIFPSLLLATFVLFVVENFLYIAVKK